jgi:hypothetical protein
MNYDEVRNRLFNHANLPGPHTDVFTEEESFVYRLWRADQDGLTLDVDVMAMDVLNCLIIANQDSRVEARSGFAYPVSCILSSGIQYHRKWSRKGHFDQYMRDSLEDVIYRIAFAWEQLLAGDIDDLLEGIEFEDQS